METVNAGYMPPPAGRADNCGSGVRGDEQPVAPDRLLSATGHGGIEDDHDVPYYYAVVSTSDRRRAVRTIRN